MFCGFFVFFSVRCGLKKDLVYGLILKKEKLKRLQNRSKLDKYNTGKLVHQKQLAFHKSTKRNRWVFGGNRTGKTECGAVEAIWLAIGIHPFKQNKKDVSGWVVSLSTRVQKDVAQKKILSYLPQKYIADIVMVSGKKTSPENGVIDTIVINNVFGGKSYIGFKSCEEGRDKFQGASLDFVWFDEEPPKDVYDECKMRVLDKKGEIFGTMTPLKGLSFVYDEIYLNSANDDEVFCLFMDWTDNPFLNQAEIERLSKTLSHEELESRKFGRFVDKNNSLVYAEFDTSIHVVEPFDVPKEWFDKISIDPGLKNPLSCHFYAVDGEGNVFVVAEHYEKLKPVQYHAQKIKEIAQSLGWPKNRMGDYEALIDAAANQQTLASEKSVSELFYENGIAVNPNVNKNLFAGINMVKFYLKSANGEAKLFIFKNCVNLIREIKGYFWGGGDAPVKRDDHALDELRYYLMTRPKPCQEFEPKSIIQKDKEKLYRRLRRNKNWN